MDCTAAPRRMATVAVPGDPPARDTPAAAPMLATTPSAPGRAAEPSGRMATVAEPRRPYPGAGGANAGPVGWPTGPAPPWPGGRPPADFHDLAGGIFDLSPRPGQEPIDPSAARALVATMATMGYSASHRAKVASHTRMWLRFAAAMKVHPYRVTAFSLAALYCWYVLIKRNKRCPGQPHNVRSLRHVASSLATASAWHGWARFSPPDARYPDAGYQIGPVEKRILKAVVKGLAKAAPPVSHRKQPLIWAILVPVLEHLRATQARAEYLATRAWMLLAYFGLLRAAEFVTDAHPDKVLRVEHVEWTPAGVRLVLHRPKTADLLAHDRPGCQVVEITTLAGQEAAADPVRALREYMEEAALLAPGAARRPLFDAAGPLTRKRAVDTVRAALLAIGAQDASAFAGHSFRSGRATDMANLGAPMPALCRSGRWASPVSALRYVRTMDGIQDLLGHLTSPAGGGGSDGDESPGGGSSASSSVEI
jgi:hypothetical protein